jgi:hypothetical protein
MQAYLEQHKIEEALDKVVKALAEQQPANPLKFMGEAFMKEANAAGGNSGGDEKKMTKAEKKAAAKAAKGGDKAESKPKEEKKGGKPDAAALEAKQRAKLEAKVIKEGGKKGVEVEGASDMGGLAFFCTYLMESDGDMELSKMAFDAMNAEPDPTEEERRGGAGHVGKVVFAAGQRNLSILSNVPEDKHTDTPDKNDPEKPPMLAMHADKWVQTIVDEFKGDIKGEVTFGADNSSGYATCYILLNDEDIAAGTATIRLKDDMMKSAYKVLNEKNCFEEDDNDGASDVIYHFEDGGDDY